MSAKELSIPSFYSDQNATKFGYSPNRQAIFEAAAEWRRQFGVKPSASDQVKIHLLGIDWQKDFCFPEGSLFVGGRSGKGAMEDSQRFSKFFYRNAARITEFTPTLDTHFAFQIFFASFWVDKDDQPLKPFREVTVDQIKSGEARVNPAMAFLANGNYNWICKQALHYCEQLEKVGKYKLFLWPFHCDMGGDGHPLVGVIREAQLFHAWLRNTQSRAEIKGGHPLTENYSILRPEVLTRWDGAMPLAQKNTGFIKTLLESDYVIIGGEASSHCVKSSNEDLLDEILSQDPKLAKKVYVLRDCMSAVTIPDGRGGFVVDYTQQADDSLQKLANAGMHVVNSTDPMESWPGMKL